MIIRATIANLTLDLAARLGQRAGLAGTAYPGLGFGAWGVEPSTTLEFAGPEAQTAPVLAFVASTLRELGESCAYVVLDQAPILLYADGHQESLETPAAVAPTLESAA